MSEGLGADIAFECAGAGASAQSCLSLLRRRGRYAQVGLFGKLIQWDMDQVTYKEIQVNGSFAHVPSAWRKALALMASGQVQTRPLISNVFPIAEWRQAFDIFERRAGLKLVLTPQ
jgi:L-iditol 2-dehydrogenase